MTNPESREAREAVAARRSRAKRPSRAGKADLDAYLRRNYGIGEADYLRMAVAQGGACAICGKAGKLVVDHDHATGCVRGLLCNGCNTAIGLVGEDAAVLRKAAAYLEAGRAS